MTTLVTGAGGFLGGHVVQQLCARGEPVRAMDIAFPGPLPDGAERIKGSVVEADDLQKAAKGASAIIHAAANARLWAPGRFDHDRINVAGTCRVLVVARQTGARVVHVSSFTTLIGANTPDGAVLSEADEIPPSQMLGAYPKSKRQAELAVLSAVKGAGVDAVIAMPSAPIGAGDVNMTPPAEMLRDLAAGKTPALIESTLNLVDVRAVATAIIAARDHGRRGERYLLSGSDISMRALASKIAALTGVVAPRFTVPMGVAMGAARVESMLSAITGKPPKAPLTGVRLAAMRCGFDNAKAVAELGFAPRDLEVCLTETLDWMKRAGHL